MKHEVILVFCNAWERIMLISILTLCQSIQLEVCLSSMPQFTGTTELLILYEIWGDIEFRALRKEICFFVTCTAAAE